MNKSFLFWLVLILLWLIFAWWACRTFLCGLGVAAAAVPAAVSTCDVSLGARDGQTLDLKSKTNLRFLNSKFENLPYGSEIGRVLQGSADYLKNNSERSLTLTGAYKSEETNASLMPNIGMARANKIKQILTSMGAPSRQINITSDLNSKLCYSNDGRTDERRRELNRLNGVNEDLRIDTLNNGISMAFGALGNTDDRLKTIYDRLKAKPMTVYFDTNAESLNLSAAQRQEVADIMYYLDNVEDGMIEISGHTDNVGNRNYNINLSGERAEFVKNHFNTKGGLSTSKMEAAGYGPDKPRASNATVEGKSENRRVEVTFK